MSQWNLSVRLTGQGSGLSRTLRDTGPGRPRRLPRHQRAAPRHHHAAGAGPQQHPPARAGGRRPAARRRPRRHHLRRRRPGPGVNLGLVDTRRLRADVSQTPCRWAARVTASKSPSCCATPSGCAPRSTPRSAGRRTRPSRVRVVADTSDLNRVGNTRTQGGGGGGGRGTLAGLLTLAPAAIPLISGLAAQLAPLTGMLTAGGAAATAFGIAIAGQIQPLTDVADAEKKYHEAVTEHGRASAEGHQAQIAYQQQLAALPPDTQRAAIALSQLKENFSDWSNEHGLVHDDPAHQRHRRPGHADPAPDPRGEVRVHAAGPARHGGRRAPSPPRLRRDGRSSPTSPTISSMR
jgi:hypothetical protein